MYSVTVVRLVTDGLREDLTGSSRGLTWALQASKRPSQNANFSCRDHVPEVTSYSKQLRSNAGLAAQSPRPLAY